MLVTNGVTASAWGFFLGSTSGPITFRVEKGGTGSFSGYSGGLVVAANPNETAYADICPGGTVNGTINVGRSGYGVITNAGTVAKLETCYVGEKAGSTGLWVHNGGTNSFQYPKDLYVGYNGTGTIDVVSGLFYWYGRPSFERVRVGESPAGTGRGAIVIEEGAGFRSLPIILGGRGSNAGYGELVLRGGTFENLHDNGADPGADVKGRELRPDNMWIGAATNATGAIAANTYGVIRGWGKFMAKDNNPSMRHQRSISAQLGRGVIIGDGEGQERTLDLAYFWRVTNALFTAGNTNGWYTVNKGAVMLPGVNCTYDTTGGDEWGCYAGTNCVGCARLLQKPDLVNAVHITSSRNFEAHGYNYGVIVLALDRSDVHSDALAPSYNPIGYWKAGPFNDRDVHTNPNDAFLKAKIDFRYDHTRVARADSKIAVLRWNKNTASWTRLALVDQPADCIVSSGEFSGNTSDDQYIYGLFCVAEVTEVGTAVLIQ